MSLMQLLAVGHSIVGIKDAPSRYKLQENWLPRFGPSSATPAVPVAAPPVALVFLPVSPPSVKLRPTLAPAAAPAPAAQPAAAISPAPREPGRETSRPSRPPSAAARVSRSRRLRWSALRDSVGARFKKTGAAPLGHPGLSLDRVRVVRNDLSDADLEIVPVVRDLSPAGEPPRRVAVAAVAAGAAAGVGWVGLAARLFKAGRGLF